MGWFHIYLSWILVSAVSVSCQELTTLLPQDDDACARSEVTFTCSIRGLQNLSSLILAWSSNEYIGNGDVLRFLSINIPGTNMTSVINENVTAILANNTMVDGVTVLVSELSIIGANQRSKITCESVTNGSSTSTEFVSSAFPGRPQSGEARERTAGDCELRVTWNPPNNTDRFDIDRYIIYVPSRNIKNVSFSTTIDLTIPNCRDGNNSIIVAAMNRLGCIGPNSSHIRLNLDTQDNGISRTAIIAIIATFIFIIIIVIVLLATVIPLCVVYYPKGKNANQTELTLEMKPDLKRKLFLELESRLNREHALELESRMKGKFEVALKYLYETLKTDSISSMQEAIQVLMDLQLDKSMSSSSIQEALRNVLGTEKTFARAQDLRIVLGRLKKRIPDVMLDIEAQLKKVGSSITMDNLIKATQKGNHKTCFEELRDKVDMATPEDVRTLLRTLFEELQESMNKEAEDELEKIFGTLEDTFVDCEMPHAKIKDILLDTIEKLQGAEDYPDGRKSSTGKKPSSSAKKPKEFKNMEEPIPIMEEF